MTKSIVTIPTSYLVLKPDGTRIEGSVDWPEQPAYELIQPVVRPLISSLRPDGPYSWFERVAVIHDGKHADMFVDEHGIQRGLPRNEAATAIYRAGWLSQHPGTDPETLNPIFGDAVLFLRRVWF